MFMEKGGVMRFPALYLKQVINLQFNGSVEYILSNIRLNPTIELCFYIRKRINLKDNEKYRLMSACADCAG